MNRRTFTLSLGLGALSGQAFSAAETFPDRPLKLLVGFSPNTSIDRLTRLVAQHLGEVLGQPIAVTNRAGASGNLAAELVANAPPDGTTLLLGSSTIGNLHLTMGERAIAPERLAPLALLAAQSLILVAHPSAGIKNFADLQRVSGAQSKPMAYSTSGIGGGAHLAMELLMQRTGLRFLHVPYQTSRALLDVLSGEVPLAMTFPVTVQSMVRQGQLIGVATSGLSRARALPEIPTFHESGLSNYETRNWQALFTSSNVPAPRVARLAEAALKMAQSPAFAQQLDALGFEFIGTDGNSVATTIARDRKRWADLVAQTGLKLTQ